MLDREYATIIIKRVFTVALFYGITRNQLSSTSGAHFRIIKYIIIEVT